MPGVPLPPPELVQLSAGHGEGAEEGDPLHLLGAGRRGEAPGVGGEGGGVQAGQERCHAELVVVVVVVVVVVLVLRAELLHFVQFIKQRLPLLVIILDITMCVDKMVRMSFVDIL